MSMTTSVIGFRPPDAKFKKMVEVYEVCVDAGIEPPKEVNDFFNGKVPDDAGVEVNIKEAVKEYHAEMQEGLEVDLQKLPKDIRYIRFVNSY